MNNYFKLVEINRKRFTKNFQLEYKIFMDLRSLYGDITMCILGGTMVVLVLAFVAGFTQGPDAPVVGYLLWTTLFLTVSFITCCMFVMHAPPPFLEATRPFLETARWFLETVMDSILLFIAPEKNLQRSISMHAYNIELQREELGGSALLDALNDARELQKSKPTDSLPSLEKQLEKDRLSIIASESFKKLHRLTNLVKFNEDQIAEIIGVSNSKITLELVQKDLMPTIREAKRRIIAEEGILSRLGELDVFPHSNVSKTKLTVRAQQVDILKLKTALLIRLDSSDDMEVLKEDDEVISIAEDNKQIVYHYCSGCDGCSGS